MSKMPKDVTTNVQLQQLAKRMRVPYFRDIFMRTILLTGEVYQNENDIVNWIMLMIFIKWRMRSGDHV